MQHAAGRAFADARPNEAPREFMGRLARGYATWTTEGDDQVNVGDDRQITGRNVIIGGDRDH